MKQFHLAFLIVARLFLLIDGAIRCAHGLWLKHELEWVSGLTLLLLCESFGRIYKEVRDRP